MGDRVNQFRNQRASRRDVSQRPVFFAAILVFAVVAVVLFYGSSWGIVPPIFASNLGSTAKARPGAPQTPTLVPTPAIQASKPTAVLVAAAMQPAPTESATATSTVTPTVDPLVVTVPSATPTPLVVGHVGNTGGQGVFLRKMPRKDSERWAAWADKTPLVLLGDEADGDGQHWLQVRDPHANVGWVPAQYIIR